MKRVPPVKKQSVLSGLYRYPTLLVLMLAALLFGGARASSSVTPFYSELTQASMRMGWSQGFLEYYGDRVAVMVASEIELASASLALAQAELPGRYQAFALEDYNSRMETNLAPRAQPTAQQIALITTWKNYIYQQVSHYIDSNTRQFVYHATCSAYYVQFGYWYGRAYAAAYAGRDNLTEIQAMRRAIHSGMKKDNCAFLLPEAWFELGVIDGTPARAQPLSFFTGNFAATMKAIRAFGSPPGASSLALALPILPGIPPGTPPEPALPRPGGVWSGKWGSFEFGTLTLVQVGNEVTGTYLRRDGKLSGTVTGPTLKGRWEEGDTQGEFVFSLSEDGQRFDTRWRIDGNEGWKSKAGDGTRR